MSSYPNPSYFVRHGPDRGESAGSAPRAATWPQEPKQRHQVPVRTSQAASVTAGIRAVGDYHQMPMTSTQYPTYPYQESRRSSASESASSHGTFHGSAVPANLRTSGGPAPRSPEEMERARRVQQEQKEKARYTSKFAPNFTPSVHRDHGTRNVIENVDRLFSGTSMRPSADSTSKIFEELDGMTGAQRGGYKG